MNRSTRTQRHPAAGVDFPLACNQETWATIQNEMMNESAIRIDGGYKRPWLQSLNDRFTKMEPYTGAILQRCALHQLFIFF